MKTNPVFTKEFLKIHNTYRSKHGAPPLKLSRIISKVSQVHADLLLAQTSSEASNNQKYGENIYTIHASDHLLNPNDPIRVWYAEMAQYDFLIETETPHCLNFTQMVWKESKEIGIGFAASEHGQVVVANYHPPGNITGKFLENVFPPLDSDSVHSRTFK